MDLDIIQRRLRDGNWVVSSHADQEAADEVIDIADIRDAILNDDPKPPKFVDPWTRGRTQ